jgi:glycosyltransferase involved in cell wall biosynthesis
VTAPPPARARKVLVLTSHHPSLRRPHQAMYGYYAYQALARHCALRFVAPHPWWSQPWPPRELVRAPTERWGAIDVELPAWWSVPAVPPLHALGMSASLARRVGAIRRAFPFDAILTAWAYPDAVAAALLAARERVPLVATVLGSDLHDLARRFGLRFQIRRGLRRARRVVAVSEALARAVGELGVPRERIVVQHNGVDGEAFSPRDRRGARAALGLAPDGPLIGYVGRLAPEKGADVLVEALGVLARRGDRAPDVVVVGGGALEGRLRARAAALRLDRRIRFVGPKGHAELPLWLSALDALCLPSRREGCPNVVLEALACGRPVVASRVGGVPELLREENGVLVAPERPEALADGLARALERRWDAAALRATVPSLSWDAVARTYRDAIEAAVADAAAG